MLRRNENPWNEDGEFGLPEVLGFILFTIGMAGLAYCIGRGLLAL